MKETIQGRKIALYGPYNQTPTGPSRVTGGLAKGLAERGDRVDIITAGTQTEHPCERVGVVTIPIEPGSVYRFWKIHRWVRDYLDKHSSEFDIFHALGGFSYESDVNTVQGALTDIDLLRSAPDALDPLREFLGANAYSLLKAKGIYQSKRVVTTSPVSTRQLRGYLRKREDKMIPLGITEDQLHDPSSVSDPPEVLFVGRIEPRKGQHRVLKRLDPKSSTYRINVVGGVADEAYLSRFRDRWTHRIHGHVSDSELENFYQEADIVVMPSHHETFGVVGLEAVGNGCALVATDKAGFSLLPESTEDNGVFVVTDGWDAAKKIRQLCCDPELYRHKNAARNYAETFIWNRIATQYQEVYDDID
jgi:glycosyltransferase involved in cell wall biosynthesis